MPELPEVETVVRSLQNNIINLKVKDVVVRNSTLRIKIDENIKAIKGSVIHSVSRKAKYIIIRLEPKIDLVIHLGMSGRLVLRQKQAINFSKHEHYNIDFDNGYQITYYDPRKFGLVTTDPEKHNLFSKLGLEPLTPEFNAGYLHEKLRNKKSPIKNSIMDGKIVVGVGNIYASESLFRAKIMPTRPSNELSQQELSVLIEKIKETLDDAINAGGSTLKDYFDTSGKPGYFQHQFNVYGKNGSACKNCNNIIQRVVLAGRAGFYCNNCQR